jgi:hypothetical protein
MPYDNIVVMLLKAAFHPAFEDASGNPDVIRVQVGVHVFGFSHFYSRNCFAASAMSVLLPAKA